MIRTFRRVLAAAAALTALSAGASALAAEAAPIAETPASAPGPGGAHLPPLPGRV